MSDQHQPTLCIDFDGVIHSYERGWQNGVIYGSVVPGFFEWAQEAQRFFKLAIYSSRSKDEAARALMHNWLMGHYATWLERQGDIDLLVPLMVSFVHEKPAAFLTIDDRAVCFMGNWRAPELEVARLLAFRSWTQSGDTPVR